MAVKANRFEEGAVPGLQYARLSRGQSWHGREGSRREMLADEKIRPALRTCGIVGALPDFALQQQSASTIALR